MKVHIKLGKKHTSKTIVKFSNYNTKKLYKKMPENEGVPIAI